MYKMHLNLDELTPLSFMDFDNKFKINLFVERFRRLWNNAVVLSRL